MSISVIVPTYNRAPLLAETLRTLAQQPDQSFELVLVDHGSTDETAALADTYASRLNIQYHYLPRSGSAIGSPKTFGAEQATGETIIFLDAGMLLPASYIGAHKSFHAQCGGRIGLGLNFGVEREDTAWLQILETADLEQAVAVWQHDPSIADPRAHLRLEDLPLPWVYAWGGNLSVGRDDFLSVGGFDPRHQGWGFEDLGLAYRLFRRQRRFAFVAGGWAVHLPHPRSSFDERIITAWKNCRLSYATERSLALEAFCCALMDLAGANATFGALSIALRRGRYAEGTLSLPLQRVPCPRLLVGGTLQDVSNFDYVALGDEAHVSNATLWSCSGVCIPLHDRSLETVVVNGVWRHLGYVPHPHGLSLIEGLISEIRRTAARAVFCDWLGAADGPSNHPVSPATLATLCKRHALPYEVIVFPHPLVK